MILHNYFFKFQNNLSQSETWNTKMMVKYFIFKSDTMLGGGTEFNSYIHSSIIFLIEIINAYKQYLL